MNLEDGSGEDAEVDCYKSSRESAEEEEFTNDVPEIDRSTDSDEETESESVDPRAAVSDDGDTPGIPDFELEDDRPDPYDADTEVEIEEDSDDDDDDGFS